MPRSVKCDCCNATIPASNAVPQYDDTYLCTSCEEEVLEEAERQYEAEEWYELNRVESLYRRTA